VNPVVCLGDVQEDSRKVQLICRVDSRVMMGQPRSVNSTDSASTSQLIGTHRSLALEESGDEAPTDFPYLIQKRDEVKVGGLVPWNMFNYYSLPGNRDVGKRVLRRRSFWTGTSFHTTRRMPAEIRSFLGRILRKA